MLAENEQVHVFAGHLAQEIPLHLPVFTEIQETVMGSLTEGVWKILPEYDWFLAPDSKAVRIVSVTGEESEVVQDIVLPVRIRHLAEVLAQDLIFVTFHHCRHFHSGRIDVRTQMLCPFF